MLDRDYVWCLAQQLLDDEEELDRLCPACRARAEEARCPGSQRLFLVLLGQPGGFPAGLQHLQRRQEPQRWARFERLKQEGGAI